MLQFTHSPYELKGKTIPTLASSFVTRTIVVGWGPEFVSLGDLGRWVTDSTVIDIS